MRTVSLSTQRCKACGARGLDEERAEWLLAHLQRRIDYLQLDGAGYSFMNKMYGFSRRDLTQAVCTLRDRGLVKIEDLIVVPIEEAPCPA